MPPLERAAERCLARLAAAPLRRPLGRLHRRPPRPACAPAGLKPEARRTFAPSAPRRQEPPGNVPGKPPMFSVAPMIDVSDIQFRHLCRLCSPNATLYTDMVHANLFVHGPAEVLLAKQPARDNCVLQLGGCDPATMRRAAEKAREMGWREINLNVGCPSDKVQRGFFGAVLMKDPELVARLCTAIADGLGDGGEVSVKCRIGIDDLDSYEFVHNFVTVVSDNSPVRHFVIHARKAYLQGLSPEQNRTVPPLDHPRARRLKSDFPRLFFTANGGISSIDDIREHLAAGMDGVMVGRKVQNDVYYLAEVVEPELYGTERSALLTRSEVLARYADYADEQQTAGVRPSILLRAVLHLQGGPTGKHWRRIVDGARVRAARAGTLEARHGVRRLLEDAWNESEKLRALAEATLAQREALGRGLLEAKPVRLTAQAV